MGRPWEGLIQGMYRQKLCMVCTRWVYTYGVNGKLMKVIRSLYMQGARHVFELEEGCWAGSPTAMQGVRQGRVPSPWLFNVSWIELWGEGEAAEGAQLTATVDQMLLRSQRICVEEVVEGWWLFEITDAITLDTYFWIYSTSFHLKSMSHQNSRAS